MSNARGMLRIQDLVSLARLAGWWAVRYKSQPQPFLAKLWPHGRTAEIKSLLVLYPHRSHSRTRKNEYLNLNNLINLKIWVSKNNNILGLLRVFRGYFRRHIKLLNKRLGKTCNCSHVTLTSHDTPHSKKSECRGIPCQNSHLHLLLYKCFIWSQINSSAVK